MPLGPAPPIPGLPPSGNCQLTLQSILFTQTPCLRTRLLTEPSSLRPHRGRKPESHKARAPAGGAQHPNRRAPVLATCLVPCFWCSCFWLAILLFK